MLRRNLGKAFALLLMLLLSQLSYSQEKVITGKVTDSKDGSGIAGVNVTARGTTTGTQTGPDGTFRISVASSVTTLVFSNIGYGTREVNIDGKTSLDVSMDVNAATMSEVVVIGYGTTRKKDLTGSIATVSSKDFQKGNITTPEQLIAGKVAGVSIISNGGAPGSGSQIRIRGGSSLNASNDPLIVIDGVPLDNGNISGASNPLSFINANDIETFTVLKDASAAAIYGTRAANGVIIITTKKGRSDKLRINFNSVNSLSKVTDKVDVLTGDELRAVINEKGTGAQKAAVGAENTNWQDVIYQTAFASDNNISITGGIKALPYRVSLGYLNQEGVLLTDHLSKYSAALVFNPVLFDNHLKIDINLKASIQKYRFADQGAIGGAVFFDPTQPVYSNSKRFGGLYEWLDPATGNPSNQTGRNPLGVLLDRHNVSDAKRSIGNIQFDYKFHFLPDLHANLNLGYDVSKGTGTTYVSDSSGIGFIAGGEDNQYKQTKRNSLLEFYLNYAKDISAIKSRIDVMAGYSYNNYLTTVYNFPFVLANGSIRPNSTPLYPFNKPEHTLISYFGRLNYTFNDKYLLTATLRRDGSSRFAPKYRWGLFPSVAFAWKLKDESFLRNSKTFSDLKLRLGYGITGQQDGIGDYDYNTYYALSDSGSTYTFGNVYYRAFRPGGFYADRKWEETTTYNVGLDYGFLNNRITGSIDIYLKKTKDLLNNISQPAGTNFAAFVVANVGSMENRGIEFNINAQPVRSKNVTWDVAFNATYNKNEITLLTVVPDDPNYRGFPSGRIEGAQGSAFINQVGYSKNTFYLYHQIYGKDGKPIEGLFEDLNRDGIINEDDLYKGKRADPNLFFGFSTSATYKKWSAGFVLRANFNNYVYNNVYSNNGRLNQVIGGPFIGNVSANYLETGFTGATDLQLLSDYYIQNASFLRMDNFNIGYNVGEVFKQKANLRLNFIVQNVFVITKYTGLDPEKNSGIDYNFYPRPRIYSLGLNLDLN